MIPGVHHHVLQEVNLGLPETKEPYLWSSYQFCDGYLRHHSCQEEINPARQFPLLTCKQLQWTPLLKHALPYGSFRIYISCDSLWYHDCPPFLARLCRIDFGVSRLGRNAIYHLLLLFRDHHIAPGRGATCPWFTLGSPGSYVNESSA